MPANIPSDTEAFFSFLAHQLQNGGRDKSPEELLSIWRTTCADDVEEIRQGIRDFEAGRFRPFDQIDDEIRAKFGFSATQE